MGYIVHKILMCSLGRLHEDDRDHLGKKRLDLAGPLMGGLFRILFKKLTKDVHKYLQKCLNEGKGFNPILAIRAETLSSTCILYCVCCSVLCCSTMCVAPPPSLLI